jgi:membrane fusion protein (multidrug efflux system)
MNASTNSHPEVANEPAPAGRTAATESPHNSPPAAGQIEAPPPVAAPSPPAAPTRWQRWRKRLLAVGAVLGLAGVGHAMVPWLETEMNTVSTDDAYINGHVTYVAPRVSGQVSRVLVDDNQRVKKGDLLVKLDPEPYQVQVEIKTAAVVAAETDLVAARAAVQASLAQAGSQRWNLQNAMERVSTQIVQLRADIASYQSKLSKLELARGNYERGEKLQNSGGVSREEQQQRREAFRSAEADAEQALQTVHADRVSLGLPPLGSDPNELAEVPPNLDQEFSSVRSSLASLLQTSSQLGLPLPSWMATPRQVLEEFEKRDHERNIDRILQQIIPNSPQVKQAEAKLLQARRDLEQAQLNLRYCNVVSDIDGVVTSRNVNTGNFIQSGQQLMAVRSVTEIWVDANFKETQLADLRIGQRVRCEVDMYGNRREYEGRITGFTMGTGQTLSLLPAQNATGNFVKIVQRLPVRIEFTDYQPEKAPLFVGLSVTPYVYFKEPPTGPNAGDVLQPFAR